jgi:hypothetical protein
LLAAYRAKRATVRGLPLSLGMTADDAQGAILFHNIQLVVRALGVPVHAARELLRETGVPRELNDMALGQMLTDAAAEGVTPAGCMRDAILEEHDLLVAAEKRDAEAIAAAKRHKTELVEYDLHAEGLVELTTDDASSPYGQSLVYLTKGLPFTDGDELPMVFRSREGNTAVVMYQTRTTGVVKMTREAYAQIGAPPDEVVARVLESRRRTLAERTYQPSEFTGSALTVEGRHALQNLRLAAWGIVREYDGLSRGALALFQNNRLMTLGVAFGGRVSHGNTIATIQTCLIDYAAQRAGKVLVYDADGRKSYVAQPHSWPPGLPRVDAVPGLVAAALAGGSYWCWNELRKEPSKEDIRRLQSELNPFVFGETVKSAVSGLIEVSSQFVYDLLFKANLVSSPTPSPELRGRTSATLEKLGFEYRELGTKRDGNRRRAWFKPSADATTDEQAAQ